MDVWNVGAMPDLFDRVSRDWGGLETLCVNAGIAGQTALIEDQDIHTFRQCLYVNLIGSLLAVQGAMSIMKAAGGGCILFTGSTSGSFGTPWRAPYVASKWANEDRGSGGGAFWHPRQGAGPFLC